MKLLRFVNFELWFKSTRLKRKRLFEIALLSTPVPNIFDMKEAPSLVRVSMKRYGVDPTIVSASTFTVNKKE